MAGLFGFGWDYLPGYQFRAASGTPGRRDISAQSRGSHIKFARAFSSEVDTGSREENASKQESRASVLIQSEPIML
jgi:hypothetical protein